MQGTAAVKLQQCLPLAVLKPESLDFLSESLDSVATVLTACGIETVAPTVSLAPSVPVVATVLTACGIETRLCRRLPSQVPYRLQQCLPLAVLKLNSIGQS